MEKELIFAFINGIDNRIEIENQKIQFSNKYNIKMIEDISEIGKYKGIDIEEKENIYDEFFSKKIKDINIIVGENGIGKTAVLNLIGTDRVHRKGNKNKWHFFLLYKLGDYFILEGNDFSIVKDILEFEEKNYHSIDDEFSLKCKYNNEIKKFELIKLCNENDEINSLVKILYYQDSSMEKIKWIKPQNKDKDDLPICFKREYVKPKSEEIYAYIASIGLIGHKSNLKKVMGKFEIIPRIKIKWLNQGDQFIEKNAFIFDILCCLFIYFYDGSFNEELNRIIKPFEGDEFLQREFEYKDYNSLKKTFMNLLEDKKFNVGLELIKNLEELDNNFFYDDNNDSKKIDKILSKGTIKFEVNETKYNKNIYNVLKCITKLDPKLGIFEILYSDMSAGERKMIDVFSSIQSSMERKYKNYIVLLDEPEKGLHPELSRLFIKNIVLYTENLIKKYECNFQFIITTHSPFMISDIPKPYIHCMKKMENGKVEIYRGEMGLLSNIPDIMKKTFFLKSPFGDLANNFFEEFQKQIGELKENDFENKKNKKIQEIINDIDEPTVKIYLQKSLDKKTLEICKDKKMLIEHYKTLLKNLQEDN